MNVADGTFQGVAQSPCILPSDVPTASVRPSTSVSGRMIVRTFRSVRRPSMRFVPIKTAEQQSALMMHRVRIAEPFRPLSSTRPFSAEFCISSCPGSVVFVMPTKKRKDMPGLHWAANEIALDFVAIGLAQEIELLGAFDALCDDADL